MLRRELAKAVTLYLAPTVPPVIFDPLLYLSQIAALPTNTAMRAQVEGERAEALQNLRRTLAAENRMKR